MSFLKKIFGLGNNDILYTFNDLLKAIIEDQIDIVHTIVDQNPDLLNEFDSQGRTAAFAASQMGRIECLRIIAEHDPASLSKQSYDGISPALIAAEAGQAECLGIIAQKAPLSFQLKAKDESTPALMAAQYGYGSCLEIIAKVVPSSLETSTKQGTTPAHQAAQQGHSHCLSIIARIAPNTLGKAKNNGSTPAYMAAQGGHINCLEIIAQSAPASFSQALPNGETPAHIAAAKGHTDCLKIIATLAPDTLTAITTDGNTPAFIAAQEGQSECLKILKNLVPHTLLIPRKDGATPVQMAKAYGHDACLEIIKEIETRKENEKFKPNIEDKIEIRPPIEDLDSSEPKKRLACLGLLINSMWAENPKEQADAIKLVASLLKHTDSNMVFKAASGLCERGGIGVRYMEAAARDPQINEAARKIISYYAKMSNASINTGPFRCVDLTWEDLSKKSQEIVSEALRELKYHTFSSKYGGKLPQRGSFILRYIFEIDLSRSTEEQVVISFQYVNSEDIVRDEDCIPVVSAFAQHQQYQEILDIPFKTRYFSWQIT